MAVSPISRGAMVTMVAAPGVAMLTVAVSCLSYCSPGYRARAHVGMGAKLIQHGVDEVVFVLRPSSSNVAALREGGLKYRAVEEDDIFDLPASSCTVATTEELKSVGPVDAVILCVKTFQVASSIKDLAPLVGPETVVISTQNGVEAPDTIAAVFAEERTLCGVVRVLSYIESADTTNGLVIRKNIPGSYHIGEIFPKVGVSSRVEKITATMAAAGVAAVAEPDIRTNAWEKLVSFYSCGGEINR